MTTPATDYRETVEHLLTLVDTVTATTARAVIWTHRRLLLNETTKYADIILTTARVLTDNLNPIIAELPRGNDRDRLIHDLRELQDIIGQYRRRKNFHHFKPVPYDAYDSNR